jgi:hypothetical protein
MQQQTEPVEPQPCPQQPLREFKIHISSDRTQDIWDHYTYIWPLGSWKCFTENLGRRFPELHFQCGESDSTSHHVFYYDNNDEDMTPWTVRSAELWEVMCKKCPQGKPISVFIKPHQQPAEPTTSSQKGRTRQLPSVQEHSLSTAPGQEGRHTRKRGNVDDSEEDYPDAGEEDTVDEERPEKKRRLKRAKEEPKSKRANGGRWPKRIARLRKHRPTIFRDNVQIKAVMSEGEEYARVNKQGQVVTGTKQHPQKFDDVSGWFSANNSKCEYKKIFVRDEDNKWRPLPFFEKETNSSQEE